MNTVCKKNQCTGCMACVNSCPKGAITVIDEIDILNASIDPSNCIGCNRCHKVCQINNSPEYLKPIEWLQGWSNEDSIRRESSSGGAASAISKAFIKNGGVVCSCCYDDGEFHFSIADSIEKLKKFRGSKYVKSNMASIYNDLQNCLVSGTKVLFIGLPCQVAGIKNYINKSLLDRLYTIDLICHGTPSAKLLELYLKQKDYNLAQLREIKFRDKYDFRVHGPEIQITQRGVKDAYIIGFTNGISYTENCYSCPYAQESRISDLTLGDAWGSNLPKEEKVRGISLLVVSNEKGRELISMAEMHIEAIEEETAIKNNHQLSHPMAEVKGRKSFFIKLKKGEEFEKIIAKEYPSEYIKQRIKSLIIKAGHR